MKKQIDMKLNKEFIEKIIYYPNAITLIALVITIVILIILAGVTINLSIGENGIFNKAKYATEQTQKAQILEKLKIKILNLDTSIMGNENRRADLNDLLKWQDISSIYYDKEIIKVEKLEEDKFLVELDEYQFELNEKLEIINMEKSQNNTSSQETLLLYSSFDNKTSMQDLVSGQMAEILDNYIEIKSKEGQIGDKSIYFPLASSNNRIMEKNERFNFGLNDFTIEFWSYAEEPQSPYAMFCADNNNSQLQFLIQDSYVGNTISLSIGSDWQRVINTGINYANTIGKWTHYALVRKDGEFTIYQNGKNIGKSTGASNISIDLTELCIGGDFEGNTGYKGYIDNFAIYSVAKYTEEFTPSRVINMDNIISYFDFEGTLKDEKNNIEYENVGGIYNTISCKKNGERSAYFPTIILNNRLIENNEKFNFGLNDFTIEFWSYAEEQQSPYAMFCADNNNSQLLFLIQDSYVGNTISLSIGSDWQRVINTGINYADTIGKWTHYALVRKDGEFTIYQNGKNIGKSTGASNISIDLTEFCIGGNSDIGTGYKGYIDDFKIYNIAKYEADFDIE